LGVYQLARYYPDQREAEAAALRAQAARTDVPESFRAISQIWLYLLTGDSSAERFVLDTTLAYGTANGDTAVKADIGSRAFEALRDMYVENARPVLRNIAERPRDVAIGMQALASLFYVYQDFSFVDERIAAALKEGVATKGPAQVALEWRIAAARNTEQLRSLAQSQPVLFQRFFIMEASKPIESWIFQHLGSVPLSIPVATKSG
jgi:hypothetical protein